MTDLKRMATNLGHKSGQYFSKAKEKSQIKLIEQKIQSRQKRFGVDFLTLRERGASKSQQEKCTRQAKKDIAILRGQIEEHEETYASKKADVKAKIAKSGSGSKVTTSSSTPKQTSASKTNGHHPPKPKTTSNPPRAKPPVPRANTQPPPTSATAPPRSKTSPRPIPATKRPLNRKPATGTKPNPNAITSTSTTTSSSTAPRSKTTTTKHKPIKHKAGSPTVITPTSSPSKKATPVAAPVVSKPKPAAAPVVSKPKPAAAPVVPATTKAPKSQPKPICATIVHKAPKKIPKPMVRANSPTRVPQTTPITLPQQSLQKRSPEKQSNPTLQMFGDSSPYAQLNPTNFINILNDDDDSPYGHGTDVYSQPKPRKPYVPAPIVIEKDGIPPGFENADSSKWFVTQIIFKGAAKYDKRGYREVVEGVMIQDGINKFKANPGKYVAMWYYKIQLEEMRPGHDCKFTYLHREGTSNYRPVEVPDGNQHCLLNEYSCLPPMEDDELPMEFRDEYTDHMSFFGQRLHEIHRPLLPGRGMGLVDSPLLKIIGDVDPSDIAQGKVGDCWLLSGIASVAEFENIVRRLFRKTKGLEEMPRETPNKYTITLWDLSKWEEVDIVIDERLAVKANGKGLLGSKPSEDGELWVPYLEKALACHCGGWDKINGGQCTHAWALLTGLKEQYTFKRTNDKKWGCFAKYDTSRNKWAKHRNSPWDTVRTMWQIDWPETGGGGEADLEVSEKDLFRRMEIWHKHNFMVAAGTQGDSDEHTTGGLVDNHAYSIIETHTNVAGTGVDLLKLRNPWGKGEIEDGKFEENGPGWEEYPEIKKALKPTAGDDGVFWVTRKEFFKSFVNVFLCAHDMTKISSEEESEDDEEESDNTEEGSEEEEEEEEEDDDTQGNDESDDEEEDESDEDDEEDDESDDDESDEDFVEQLR